MENMPIITKIKFTIEKFDANGKLIGTEVREEKITKEMLEKFNKEGELHANS